MIEHAGRRVLLDIEGTTSSISFVYDVMFPYARRHLDEYLSAAWEAADCRSACDAIARDAGHASLDAWAAGADPVAARALVRNEVVRLMDGDVKATGLKAMQGLIWQSGFESGEMQAHVYDDVPPALAAWNAAGCDLRIYSSGSIAAQKLFFGHTVAGDLLSQFRGHYDTTTGPKKEAASYTAIAAKFVCAPSEILFLSDVVAELDAARAAEFTTALCRRPGNPDPPALHDHVEISDFRQVRLG